MKLDPPPDLVEIAEALDAMAKHTWEAAERTPTTPICPAPRHGRRPSGWHTTESQEERINGRCGSRSMMGSA